MALRLSVGALVADLRDLANDFEGHADAECEGQDSTAFRRRYVDLVEREHLLEGRVVELEKRYSGDLVQFTLTEYTPKR